jgi:hypothetical protein
MAFGVFLRNATGQHDRLGDDQLGHAAGIGVGRVEHRDAGQFGRVQVDLVGADAEAAHRHQALGVGQYLGAQLRARADADDVRLGDARLQLVFGQRLAVQFDLRIAGGGEHVDRGLAHPLQQQYADILLRERGLLRRHVGNDGSEGGSRPLCQNVIRFGALRNTAKP